MTRQELVSEGAIQVVFKNARFGNISHRDVILENLKHVHSGYHIGSTAKHCLLELGLVKMESWKKYQLTKIGELYLNAEK